MSDSKTPKPQLYPKKHNACRICGSTYMVKDCPVFIRDTEGIEGFLTVPLCGWCDNKLEHGGGWIDGIRSKRKQRKR